MPFNVVIAEDEPLASARLQRFLSNMDEVAEVHVATDGEQALELMEQFQPELMVLDINMPKLTGLEVAAEIKKSSLRPPAIIFITAYDEFALEAFKVNAMAYLLKPIQESELRESVERAGQINRVQANEVTSIDQQSIMLKRSSTIESLKITDIVYFRASEKLVVAGLVDGNESIISLSLKQLEEKLSPAFIRIHRHTLVNIHFLQSIQKSDDHAAYEVSLEHSKQRFPVSRRQVAMIKKIFTERHLS